MTAWDGTSADILADVQALIARLKDPGDPINHYQPIRLPPLSRWQYAEANRLLGRPEDAPLTEADVWEAARIDYEQRVGASTP